MALLSREAMSTLSVTNDAGAIAAVDAPVFADTREIDVCARESIEGALCLSPSLFLYPDGTLASFRDINWLAGTFGLDPASTVVVFGRDASDNDFVAGILFLLGQSRVVIWQGSDRSLLGLGKRGAGRLRGMLRSRFYTAAMRDEHVALDDDASRFFSAGKVMRLAWPDSLEEAGPLSILLAGNSPRLYRRDIGPRGDGRRDDEGSLLLLAETPYEAVAHFARLASRNPRLLVRVHPDGLRGRSARALGAQPSGIDRPALLAALLIIASVVCAAVVLHSRKKRTG